MAVTMQCLGLRDVVRLEEAACCESPAVSTDTVMEAEGRGFKAYSLHLGRASCITTENLQDPHIWA